MNPIDAERWLFADTLELVGPDATTNAGAWTALDVAAHVLSLDRLAGVSTFIGRSIVARGVRLNDLIRRRPKLTEISFTSEKRRGIDWAIAELRTPSPRLLLRPSVRAVSLFEVWTHHEDVRRPNGVPRDEHPDLTEVIAFLQRYGRIDQLPDGPQHEVAYRLAGRDGGPRPI